MKKLFLSVALLMAVPSVYADSKDHQLQSAFGLEFGKAYSEAELDQMDKVECQQFNDEVAEVIACKIHKPPKPYYEFEHYGVMLLGEQRILTGVLAGKNFGEWQTEDYEKSRMPCGELQQRVTSTIEKNRGINLKWKRIDLPDFNKALVRKVTEKWSAPNLAGTHKQLISVTCEGKNTTGWQLQVLYYLEPIPEEQWPKDTSGL